MDTRILPGQTGERRRRLLETLARAGTDWQRQAVVLDQENAFPDAEVAALRGCGALAAPVPAELGGLGWGTERDAARDIMQALRLVGRGNLSLGRLYEAHVNALRLVVRYGTPAQARTVAGDALAGHLFGLWVTDPPDAPLRLGADDVLLGAKAPCSGAGRASRAVVTVRMPSGETRLLLIAAPGPERADLTGWETQGMRAAGNGRVRLDGIAVAPDAVIGAAGDYLRQPDFSAGAWRTSAVTLGGLEALVGAFRAQLVARGREQDPHQRTRVGHTLIAQETARMWVERAAVIGEAALVDAADSANTVNLARVAVETACLETMHIVQRGLGLAAFRRGMLVELLLRDLSTYLRQPAPDETLAEAAAHFMQRDPPVVA